MRWYSNERWFWIVVRGLLVALLGAVAVSALDLHRVSWIAVIGVPALLTLVNLSAWYKAKQRRPPHSVDRN
jgi:hypothetical protein